MREDSLRKEVSKTADPGDSTFSFTLKRQLPKGYYAFEDARRRYARSMVTLPEPR